MKYYGKKLIVFLLSSVYISSGKIYAQNSATRDWTISNFKRPEPVQPILQPDTNAVFTDPVTKQKVHWRVNATFNPAAIVKDDKVYVLFRAEDNEGKNKIGGHTSRIGIAVSKDGIHFDAQPSPVLFPDNDDQAEFDHPGGCEDPRIIRSEDGKYILMYTSWNNKTPRLCVAASEDLTHWKKYGSAFKNAYNGKFADIASKSASIVTQIKNGKQTAVKINGKYLMYWGEHFVNLATSEDLIHWQPMTNQSGNLMKIIQPRNGYFDSKLTECGPPALLTDKGILLLYNGKNEEGNKGDTAYAAGSYCAGQVLFDTDNPVKVKARLDKPFFIPEEPYERTGQYAAGTVFIEGMVPFHGKWFLYYGCADSRVGVATTDM